MSENLPKLAVETFSTILRLKLQQTRSMLRGRVEEGYHVGKMASPVDYIGAIQMKRAAGRVVYCGATQMKGRGGRFAPTQPKNTDFPRRWVTPVDKEAFQLIDTFD